MSEYYEVSNIKCPNCDNKKAETVEMGNVNSKNKKVGKITITGLICNRCGYREEAITK